MTKQIITFRNYSDQAQKCLNDGYRCIQISAVPADSCSNGGVWMLLEKDKNPWISVNERLPKEGQHIVMYDSDSDGYRTIYYPEPYITDNMDYWMPIPELPKED